MVTEINGRTGEVPEFCDGFFHKNIQVLGETFTQQHVHGFLLSAYLSLPPDDTATGAFLILLGLAALKHCHCCSLLFPHYVQQSG